MAIIPGEGVHDSQRRRLYEKPSKDELIALLEECRGAAGVGRKLGISSTTTQRWCRDYCIDITGYSQRGGPPKYTLASPGVLGPGSIPTPVFGPIIKQMVDDYETAPVEKARRNKGPFDYGKLSLIFHDVMPDEYSVSARTVQAIISQERAGVSLKTADRILCWMNANHLWHYHPLNEFYWEGKPRPEGLDAIVRGLVQMHSEKAAA